MNFDLTELTATLAIGILSIAGLGFVILIFSGSKLSSIVASISRISQYVVVIILACCFAIGMIVEDVSNKFVDDENWLSGIIESDDEIKAEVFFGEDYRQSIHESPLSFRASKYGLLGKYGGTDAEALENHILQKRCDPDEEKSRTFFCDEKLKRFKKLRPDENIKTIKLAAKNFYYNAKGIAYQDSSYYNELKRIQMRIDFSRSLVAVSIFFFAIVTLVLFLIKISKLMRSVLDRFLTIIFRSLSKLDLRDRPKVQKVITELQLKIVRFRHKKLRKPMKVKLFSLAGRLSLAYIILGLMFFAARYAYSSEEREFDKRIYGYYLSLKIDPKDSKAEALSVRCVETTPVKIEP